MLRTASGFPLHPEEARLRALLRASTPFGVSVVVPSRVGADSAQRAVLVQSALDTAEKGLVEVGIGTDAARDAARRLAAALEPARGNGSRAVLLTAADVQTVDLAAELPFQVRVGRGLAVRPLLRALALAPPFHLLAVSERSVRLFASDGLELVALPLGRIPASLEDALGSEQTEKELRLRGTRTGGGAPVYYSHGAAAEERKHDRERFEEVLARSVNERFAGDATPLVLATETAHLHGLHARLRVPGLVEGGVAACPDTLSHDELRRRGAHCVAAAAEARTDGLALALERAHAAGKVRDQLNDIAEASVTGRVRRLYVEAARKLPGFVDSETARVVEARGDDDVLDAIASAVLAHGGEVYALPAGRLAGPEGVTAELR
jgi:hypothetical protein